MKATFIARGRVGVMSATRRSALPESSAGIRPSQSKSRKVIFTPISFAISSASSTELPVRSPLAPTREKGGPCVCTATRSSPRLMMSSRVPALAAPAIPSSARPATKSLAIFIWHSSLLSLSFRARIPVGLLFERRHHCRRHPPFANLIESQVTVSATVMPRLASSSRKRPSGTCVSGLSRPGSVISRRASICATMLAG